VSRLRFEIGLIAIVALALIALIVAKSPAAPIYDEGPFLENLALMNELGFSREFLVEMGGQSPGPLYQMVHAVAQPLSRARIRPMRLINAACLLGAVLALALTFGGAGWGGGIATAGRMFAIPGVWVVGGMALTEAPAMLLASSGAVLLIWTVRRTGTLTADCALSAVAGSLVALAILGRQPYLVVPAVAWILAYQASRREVVLLTAFTVAAAVAPLLVFLTWGGLVPPMLGNVQSGLNPYFALLGFGYAGVFTVFLAPRWFQSNRGILAAGLAVAVLGVGVNAWTRTVLHMPMASVARPLLGPVVSDFTMVAFPVVFVVFGLYFVASSVMNMRARSGDTEFLFYTLATLAIILTCAKSSAQFSSRYVVQAAPFLVAMTAGFAPAGTGRIARLLAGAALGVSSLLSYYG